MKVLIFDREIETLNFLSEIFNESGCEVSLAENGSRFMNFILGESFCKFDAVIICRKELKHYGIDEEYLLKKSSKPLLICSYLHSIGHCIKEIKIAFADRIDKSKAHLEEELKSIIYKCENETLLNKDFVESLPKKSAILLKHLLLHKKEGLSDKEIAELFWGDNYRLKMNCIYNHVYNLRKSLKSKFEDAYIIYKVANRYKIIESKKGA